MDELQNFYAREGFVTVGLVWISMSLLGTLPFVLSGDIPNYLDAVFETVSGFTAALACISNIGPGMGQIGPASCFNIFSAPVKKWCSRSSCSSEDWSYIRYSHS